MIKKALFFFLSLFFFNVSLAEEDIETEIISTFSGPVRGKVVSKNNKEHYEFLGIPYAQPPVGKLRFKDPKPVEPWTDVLNAFTDGPTCMQNRFIVDVGDAETANKFQGSGMSEDCLTLNIFTNNIGLFQKKPQAVMVWIHGGGFTSGSKDAYRMQGIVDEDVVLVAMNYRLHALGFLSFGNNLVSGNMGLKDQQLAIQWVKANIRPFGGDPDRITIFGESAGGMSVHAHVMSPSNFGGFVGAIAQSGSILFLSNGPMMEKQYAKNALSAIGCPTSMDKRSLECLQAADSKDVTKKITDSNEDVFNLEKPLKFSFSPVVDSYAVNPFLPLDPLEAMKSGMFNRVAYMSGTVSYEGCLSTGAFGLTGVKGAAQIETLISPPKTPFSLNYEQDLTANKVAQRFYNHSTGETLFEEEKPAIDFYTDTLFLSTDHKTVELMSEYTNDVYNYYLTQPTNHSVLGKAFGLGIEYTPTHADDLVFITTGLIEPESLSEEEKLLSQHMNRYWTTFAKFGKPSHIDKSSPVWYPYDIKEKNYMELKAKPEMKKQLHKERMFFWNKMIWEKRERLIEKKQLYVKTTQFLLNYQ